MKKSIILLAILTLSVGGFAQTNKPNVGDWGVKVGVNVPNWGIGFTFSRMLKKNLECGASLGASFSTSKYAQTNNTIIYTLSGDVIGTHEFMQKSLNYTLSVAPFLAYHIPINNNLDVYAGGRLYLSMSKSIYYTSQTRYYAPNFEDLGTSKQIYPFSFGAGAGVLIGADYYFKKNMAIGVSGNLGFAANFQFGKNVEKRMSIQSGSQNPYQGFYSSEQSYTLKNIYTSTGANGNVGINFTFYFARKGESVAASK